jgi:hypothetical protein
MRKQLDLFQGYPLPKTSEQEVLLTLLTQGYVSIFDFSYLSGFRTRVSQLKSIHGLSLETKKNSRCNKFGNQYTYSIHFLPESQKDTAKELYLKLNSRN